MHIQLIRLCHFLTPVNIFSYEYILLLKDSPHPLEGSPELCNFYTQYITGPTISVQEAVLPPDCCTELSGGSGLGCFVYYVKTTGEYLLYASFTYCGRSGNHDDPKTTGKGGFYSHVPWLPIYSMS